MWHLSEVPSSSEIMLKDLPIGSIAIHPRSKNTYYRVNEDSVLGFFSSKREISLLHLGDIPESRSYLLAPKDTKVELIQE